MSASFTSEYPDAFRFSKEKILEQREFSPKYAKHQKKEKKLLKEIKELRAQYIATLEEVAEERRIAEEARIAEKERKGRETASFFTKLGDAIIKAIPKALTALLKFCAKSFFTSKSFFKSA